MNSICIDTMNFIYNDINPIGPSTIPIDTTHLIFGNNFNQPLTPVYIPDSVTHITFGDSFNQPLTPDCMPDSVTHIVFGVFFNQPLTRDCIPSSVKYLYFRSNFDYRTSAEEIIMNPEIEINFNAYNTLYPKNRIVHLFYFGHNQIIPRNGIDLEETIVGDEWNDYIIGRQITKIRLTPKILFQSRTKSAAKV